MKTLNKTLVILLLLAIPGIAFAQRSMGQPTTGTPNHNFQHHGQQHPGNGDFHHHRNLVYPWGFYPYWEYPAYYYWYYDPSYYSFNNTPSNYSFTLRNNALLPSPDLGADPKAINRQSADLELRPQQARLEVILPDAEAELQIDRKTTTSVGSVRQFDTPDLDSGKLYSYTLVTKWKEKGQTRRDVRKVDVRAGSRYIVDFTKPAASEPIPGPSSVPAPSPVRSPW